MKSPIGESHVVDACPQHSSRVAFLSFPDEALTDDDRVSWAEAGLTDQAKGGLGEPGLSPS